ncbi:hypothetical protein GCM10010270_07650 [Streptomyces violaceus]|nr:hypothetical protein GCM10010270_07650 [Streptomyces janthinus]
MCPRHPDARGGQRGTPVGGVRTGQNTCGRLTPAGIRRRVRNRWLKNAAETGRGTGRIHSGKGKCEDTLPRTQTVQRTNGAECHSPRRGALLSLFP